MTSETRGHILGRSTGEAKRKRRSRRQNKGCIDIQAEGVKPEAKNQIVQSLASCIVLKNRGAEKLLGLYAHLENCTGKAKREN
jgi:hypothetical protein